MIRNDDFLCSFRGSSQSKSRYFVLLFEVTIHCDKVAENEFTHDITPEIDPSG
jgi:hypothetical protein